MGVLGGKIDSGYLSDRIEGDDGYNVITVRESMLAEKGSRLLSGPEPGDENTIYYRDPAKPPVLLGKAEPAPTLVLRPWLDGCPVCGNKVSRNNCKG